MNTQPYTTAVVYSYETVNDNRITPSSPSLCSRFSLPSILKTTTPDSDEKLLEIPSMFRMTSAGRMSLMEAMSVANCKNLASRPVPDAEKPVNSPSTKTFRASILEGKAHDELHALEEKTAQLQSKLQQIQQDRQTQLATIQRNKEEKLKELEEGQCQLSATAVLSLVQTKRLYQRRKAIEELRAANKMLRQEGCELAESIQRLREENAQLEAQNALTLVNCKRLCEYIASEQNTHHSITSVLPLFQDKMEDWQAEMARCTQRMAREQRIKTNCIQCLEAILARAEKSGFGKSNWCHLEGPTMRLH